MGASTGHKPLIYSGLESGDTEVRQVRSIEITISVTNPPAEIDVLEVSQLTAGELTVSPQSEAGSGVF